MLVKVYDVLAWLMYGQVRQPCLELQRNVPAGGLGVSSLFPSCIKQLLDQVEHDIMNYQNRGLCYRLRQIIQTRGFDNS